jgi:hypothetical protein
MALSVGTAAPAGNIGQPTQGGGPNITSVGVAPYPGNINVPSSDNWQPTSQLLAGSAEAANAAQNALAQLAQTNAINTQGGGSSTGNPSNAAYYQGQIDSGNQALGALDGQKANQQRGIDTNAANSMAELQGKYNNDVNKYATDKTTAQNDFTKNISNIDNQARNGYNSLQALLGGTGSAGNILAPYAVSTQANQQRSNGQDTFAKNLQGIDIASQAAQQNFNNSKKSLDGQHQSAIDALLQSINDKKIAYQQQIGQATSQLGIAKGGSYAAPTAQNNAIQQLMEQNQAQANAYQTPTFSVSDYTAPTTNLSQYKPQAAQLAAPSSNSVPTGQDTTALTALQKLDTNNNAYAY